MIGDIVVVVICLGLVLLFREIDKQNRSLEKIKKYSEKVLSDFADYFKDQTLLVKNASVELDVKQSQAVAAVDRFKDVIEEFEQRSDDLKQKISIVTDMENRLATYDASLKDLFEMTERVEENLEKIRVHSNLVGKVSKQLDEHEKQLNKIENDIPNIVSALEKLNEEKMQSLSSDFSAWVEQRTADLQTLANAAVDKNEMLLEEIQQVYTQSYEAASQKADMLEDDIFEKLKAQTMQRGEDFENALLRNTQDLTEYIDRERTQLESALNEKITEAKTVADVTHEQFKQKADAAFAQLNEMIQQIDETLVTKQSESEQVLKQFEHNIETLLTQGRDDALQQNNEKLMNFFDEIESNVEDTKSDMMYRLERLNTTMDDINVLEENVKRLTGNIESAMQTEMESLKSNFNSNVGAALDDVNEMLTHSVNEQKEKIHSLVNQKLTEAVTEQESNIQSSLQEYKDKINSGIDVLNNNVEQSLQTLSEKVKQDINEQRISINEQNAKVGELLTERNEQLESKIIHVRSELESKLEVLSKNTHAEIERCAHLVNGQEESIHATLNDHNEKTQKSIQALRDDIENRLHNVIEKANETIAMHEEGLVQQENRIISVINDQNAYVESSVKATREDLQAKLSELSDNVMQEVNRQQAEFIAFENNYAKAEDIIKRMEETVLAKQQETQSVVDRIQYHLETNAGELAKILDDKILGYEQAFNGIVESLRSNIDTQAEDIVRAMSERCDEIQESFDSRINDINSEVSNLHDEVINTNNERTIEFFTGLDSHIKEARKDAEYRLDRLTVVGQDIDNLENNFRRLMDIAEKRVNADFEQFKIETNAAQGDFEAQSTESFNSVRVELENLDTELNNLKTTAYENVSEKLQLFEDDFFTSLTKRSEAMTESLDEWKMEFNGQLTELSANLEHDRLATEAKFAEDMKEHYVVTQERYREQLSRLEDGMKNTELQYSNRMQEIETNLHSFIDEQRTEINKAKNDVEEHFKAELESHAEVSSEKLKRFERDVSAQLGQLGQSVSATQDETSSSLESLLSDLASWRERLTEQFQENRDLYAEKFDALQITAREQIEQVEQVFSGELVNYVNRVKEEREGISVDIDELKVQTQNSLSMYESRSEEMLEEFRKAYEFMLEDTQRRVRGENSEAEQRVRALKSMVQEVRQESEEMQEKMVLKIQSEANLLKMSMDDIDKKLKQFVAQTQLFEKTDELRNELENQMSDLRTQLTRFENFKQVTDSIESQFSKIRKLDDETITRMQRLSAEKNRIDALESDFSKLIALSGSMDQKISELKSTSDDLQILQVEVRRFQETLGDISNRYDRLEKKTPVIDQTMTEIDKAFTNLRELEDRLAACAQDTMQIPETVETLKADIARLLENSRSITELSDKLSDIDDMFESTTKQVDDVEKARDGIVKVEARLADMIREAKEQINLYKAVKDGGKKSDPGAPPIAVRENVIKLARQGWKPDQIAQSLNISRGEVELILDFYGSQNV